MKLVLINALLLLALGACLISAFPSPDSAGIVERVNGLAYGGIPYGSVSGALGQGVQANLQARGGPARTHTLTASRPVYGIKGGKKPIRTPLF